MKHKHLSFRMAVTAAAALTFTVFTAACDKAQQPKIKTADLKPAPATAKAAAPAGKKAPSLVPAAPAAKTIGEAFDFLPDPVAMIGTKKITKADFIKKLGAIPPEFVSQMPKELLERQMHLAVETMVNEQILIAAAEKAGIKPTKQLAESEFNKKLKEISADKMELLKQELAKQGKTIDDLKKTFTTNPEIINMTAVNKWIETNLKNKIKVTDADISKFYKENADKFKTPPSIVSSHILITASDDPQKPADPAKDKAAKEKAEKILAQLKKGADFGALAQKESKCPSGKNKGLLGETAKGQLVPEYFDAAFAMKPGEISKVVKTPYGYHIIKLHSKKEAAVIPLDAKLKAELKDGLTAQALDKEIKAFIEQQKKTMKVQIFPFKETKPAPAKVAPAKPAPAKAAPAKTTAK